jgi:type II secretory ATPase GspE/PulE/Tfp pilus assembly ATPase PilB-like protein
MNKSITASELSLSSAAVLFREKGSGVESSIPLLSISSVLLEQQGGSPLLTLCLCEGVTLSFSGLSRKAAEERNREIGEALRLCRQVSMPAGSLAEVREGLRKMVSECDDSGDPGRVIQYIVTQAFHQRASDVHLKPGRSNCAVLYRIDGLLVNVAYLSAQFYDKALACLKNMARLLSYKKSIPQDGRLTMAESGHDLDIRVAVLPTLFGERAVLRILSSKGIVPRLDELGFDGSALSAYRGLISSPQGAIILTGPAGCGKTTTIFSSLSELAERYSESVNISTIEDPIEYVVESFCQTQTNPAMGLTFASGLRTLLRQDPNIILVGEIRDDETASIAMQAAMSGHLIFSTVHSTHALGVFSRLVDMGVEPFLVSFAITAVLHQRLVRKICPACAEEAEPSDSEKTELGRHRISCSKAVRAKGCSECNGTGYSGRTGVFELLAVSPQLQDLLHRRAPLSEMYALARAEGLVNLWEDGLAKAAKGVTTFDEIARVCPKPFFD